MTNQAVREPPILSDKQVYAYLQEMSRQINFALQQLDAQIAPDSTSPNSVAKQAENAANATVTQQAQSLRALIVQTATEVHRFQDSLSQTLSEYYVARSEYGEYQQTIQQQIEALPTGIEQTFLESETITSLIDDSTEFKTYKEQTTGYIKTGLLWYDQGVTAKVGVAIGQNLATKTENDQEVLDVTQMDFCATFVAQELAFWQSGVKVAYVSNNRLHISNADISGVMRIGDWEISHADGFTIRYVG